MVHCSIVVIFIYVHLSSWYIYLYIYVYIICIYIYNVCRSLQNEREKGCGQKSEATCRYSVHEKKTRREHNRHAQHTCMHTADHFNTRAHTHSYRHVESDSQSVGCLRRRGLLIAEATYAVRGSESTDTHRRMRASVQLEEALNARSR